MSIDCVAFLGGNRYRGGERWWLELRWTRDPLNTDAISVQGAWSVVARCRKVLKKLKTWRLHANLGGGSVFRPRRLGVLLVNRTSYRLELDGCDGRVFAGELGAVAASTELDTRRGAFLSLNTVGVHRSIGGRTRPHGARGWSKTAKAISGRKRWRDSDHGHDRHLEHLVNRRMPRHREYVTRSNSSSSTLMNSMHSVARTRKRPADLGFMFEKIME